MEKDQIPINHLNSRKPALLLPSVFFNYSLKPHKPSVWKEWCSILNEFLENSYENSSFTKNCAGAFRDLLFSLYCARGFEPEIHPFNGVPLFFAALPPDLQAPFFKQALPIMVRLILKFCPDENSLINNSAGVFSSINILQSRESGSNTLTEVECLTLLSIGFLCLFPTPSDYEILLLQEPINPIPTYCGFAVSDYFKNESCPGLNFFSFFKPPAGGSQAAKLECFVRYFIKQTNVLGSTDDPLKTNLRRIHYERIYNEPKPFDWWVSKTDQNLSDAEVTINKTGLIENSPFLQANFANRYLGGGTLRRGCVQEEILFVTRPELVVSQIMFEALQDDEVGRISGAVVFTSHKGYAGSFRCTGYAPSIENTIDMARIYLCIDASRFSKTTATKQLSRKVILRELNKLYGGLNTNEKNLEVFARVPVQPLPFATGNWGCGAFCGWPQLKFIIQWIVSAVCKRPLHYYTFASEDLQNLEQFVQSINNISIGKLVNILFEMEGSCPKMDGIFSYVQKKINCEF